MVFRWPIRILFIDTDASGRIHYTVMFRYFEAAEIDLFRAAGAMEDRQMIAFPRVHVECDFRGAIHFDDLLQIEVLVGKIGNASLELKYRVLKDEIDVASGRVVVACMDRNTQRATPIPPAIREKLLLYVAP